MLWQRIGNQIAAAFVFARPNFVNVHESVCLNLPASRRAACVLLVTDYETSIASLTVFAVLEFVLAGLQAPSLFCWVGGENRERC